MKIMQKTGAYSRNTLHITRQGVRVQYERPQVGGGYYICEALFCPWPWVKV